MGFWGLHVVVGRNYSQTALKAYYIGQAVIDINTCKPEEIVSVKVTVGEKTFHLGNLSVDHGILQVPIGCMIGIGEAVTFSASSNSESEKATVHLTGYTIEESHNIKGASNDANPIENVTNIKAKILKSSIKKVCENESTLKKDKENASPVENKQKDSKSEGKKSSEKNKKKSKSDNKGTSLTDLLNSFEVEDDDDDDEYSPEEVEEENEEIEDEDDDDDDDEEEEEEEEAEEEEEEENDDDEEENDEEDEKEINLEEEESDNEPVKIEAMEESKDEEEILKDLPKKKKRLLSPSSVGRTPIPKASKKPKIQDLSGSPALTESSTKKKKSKKPASSDSSPSNEEVSFVKTPNENGKKKTGNKESEKKKAKNSTEEKSDATPSSESKRAKKVGLGGVIMEDLVIGTGAKATNGKRVSVYYEGRLKKTGKVFDKLKSGSGFKLRLGASEVIKAWDVGIVGMKVGGKRKIVAPPSMAYGKAGAPPDIPPYSVLVFEVELKSVS